MIHASLSRSISVGLLFATAVTSLGADIQSPLHITDSAGMPKFSLEYVSGTSPVASFSLQDSTLHWLWERPSVADPLIWRTQMSLDPDSRLRLYPTSGSNAGIVLDPGASSITINSQQVLTQQAGDIRYAPYSSGILQLSGAVDQKISVGTFTGNVNGSSLTVAAGSPPIGSTAASGGTLTLSGGASYGGKGSLLEFKTAGTGPSGQMNEPATRMRVNSSGAVGIGSGAFEVPGGGVGGLDVSWGGNPATLLIGADTNLTSRSSYANKSATISMPHYNGSLTTSVRVIDAASVSGKNVISIGGGGGVAATTVQILTGATSTTSIGTSRIRVGSNGGVELGTGAVSINDASGFAIGWNANNSSYDGAAIGRNAKAAGHGSIAVGAYAEAHHGFSVALGWDTDVNQPYSHAVGFQSKANAQQATALGIATDARGYGQTVVGVANAAIASENAATYNDPNSEVFVVGSGTHQPGTGVWVTTRANALTVKRNGNTWVKGDLKVDGVLRVAVPAGDIGMGAFTAAQ